ncbi:MAG: hypothetical protein ABUL61_05770, partial [Oleiharenicola lentus]
RLTADMATDVPQVASRVFNGYARVHEADGSLKRETYAFGNGGAFDFAMVDGDGVEALTFQQITRDLAPVLARQGYVPATNPDSADLLILVMWGATRITTGKPDNYRQIEKQNIQILGFQDDVDKARSLSFTTFARDFLDELEAGRYFVVLKAYDFKTAWKEKRRLIKWETRFSIRRQGSDFVEQLPLMASYAAGTFGTETHGLIRPRDVPRGEVRLDETKYGEAVEKKATK